jgi:hypothetical protein
MAFGQTSGPPATAQQLTLLTELLARAGYEGLREARHPFGLTQRQAGGKFTRDEATELIERLTAAEDVRAAAAPTPDTPPARPAAKRSPAPPPSTRTAPADALDASLRKLPDERLARELTRRGWTCTPPP